jgi:hypothetical protein
MAIVTRSRGASRYDAVLGDTGYAVEVVEDAFGSAPLGGDELGEPTILDGAVGRGASAWTPVIEWTLTVGIPALWAAAAWDGIKRAAKQAGALVSRLRDREVQFYVSRGYAALLAIEHLLDTGAEDGILHVEAVEEPSRVAGRALTEINYVGADPWMVLVLNEPRTRRYVVAVSPDGSVLGAMGFPLGEAERAYLPPPPQ